MVERSKGSEYLIRSRKNQTDIRKVRRYVLSNRKDSYRTSDRRPMLGFGIFLLKNELGELRKEIVADISYQKCCDIGDESEVFKWVPATPMAVKVLAHSRNGCGQRCSKTCPEPGCLCFEGRCR